MASDKALRSRLFRALHAEAKKRGMGHEELREAQARIAQPEKLTALGQLAGCMSNQHFMEQKLVRDPEQPCESAVANAQLRLVLVVEPRVKDKLCESQI